MTTIAELREAGIGDQTILDAIDLAEQLDIPGPVSTQWLTRHWDVHQTGASRRMAALREAGLLRCAASMGRTGGYWLAFPSRGLQALPDLSQSSEGWAQRRRMHRALEPAAEPALPVVELEPEPAQGGLESEPEPAPVAPVEAVAPTAAIEWTGKQTARRKQIQALLEGATEALSVRQVVEALAPGERYRPRGPMASTCRKILGRMTAAGWLVSGTGRDMARTYRIAPQQPASQPQEIQAPPAAKPPRPKPPRLPRLRPGDVVTNAVGAYYQVAPSTKPGTVLLQPIGTRKGFGMERPDRNWDGLTLARRSGCELQRAG